MVEVSPFYACPSGNSTAFPGVRFWMHKNLLPEKEPLASVSMIFGLAPPEKFRLQELFQK